MQTAARFKDFPPYTPIEPYEVLSARLGLPVEQIVKCDANENPYGPSPKARRALAELAYAHIYPDPESRALRAALAQFSGVPAEYLLAGAGADELIDLLLRVLLEPGDAVISCPPTFGMYAFDTRLNAGRLVEVPRKADFSLDLDALAQAVERERPKVIFLTSPNNPDGSLLQPDELEFVLSLQALLVLDEAYAEFADAGGRLGENITRIGEVPERENLVVLRTFSKWAGLAGLRVGYGAFPGWLLPVLWQAKQPYNVSAAASAAAIASLEDLDWLADNVARIRQQRAVLQRELAGVPGLRPFPSQANFVLSQVSGREAAGWKAELAARGVFLRHYNSPGLRDMLRVSAGTPEQAEAVLAALRETAPGVGRSAQPAASLEAGISAPYLAETPSAQLEAQSPPEAALASTEPPPPPPAAVHSQSLAMRSARVERQTRETVVTVTLDLDGSGRHHADTGLPFLDHMLAQLAVHGLFDLEVTARGDLQVDPHHTVEDTALALGAAFRQALGARLGIVRTASASAPMDETLAEAVVDLSGRPYAVAPLSFQGPATGGIPNSLWAHFFESFAAECRCNLHLRVPYTRDDHHQVEALFKAAARALCQASRFEPRRAGQVPSSKGSLA